MPCCLILVLALAGPRIVLALLFFLTNYLNRAFHGLLVPLLGFIFLPWTTLAYTWIINAGHRVDGIYLILLIVAFAFDIGAHGGGYHRSRNN
jgi:hypothetical protein